MEGAVVPIEVIMGFPNVSLGAKLLCGIFYNNARTYGQRDSLGDLYLTFSLEEVAEVLNCSISTAGKYISELDECGLVKKGTDWHGRAKPCLCVMDGKKKHGEDVGLTWRKSSVST